MGTQLGCLVRDKVDFIPMTDEASASTAAKKSAGGKCMVGSGLKEESLRAGLGSMLEGISLYVG